MILIRRNLLALVLLLLSVATPAQADKVDDFIKAEMSHRHIPGLSLAIVKDGTVIKAKGYGLSDIELKVPATPQSVYQIASSSKQFTAAAIMLLVEDGKVSLDETINKYLPDLPVTWRGATVRQLLTHTSGIKDYSELADAGDARSKDFTRSQIIALVSEAPLEFQLGEKWNYSNTGYFLLGMIIERVSGQAFGEFMHNRIFRPLGMGVTRMNDLNEIVSNRAAGYVLRNGSLHNAQPVSPTHPWAAGALLSTVLDLAKWDAALYTERLLRKSSLEQIWAPAKLNNGQLARDSFFNNHYGFGWFLGEIDGHKYVEHGGVIPSGFASEIIRFSNDRLTIIVLTNRHADDFLASEAPRPWDIAKGIASLYIPALTKNVRKRVPLPDSKGGSTQPNNGMQRTRTQHASYHQRLVRAADAGR
jgi:D-alanyl-D-alanine carboxypeptidase